MYISRSDARFMGILMFIGLGVVILAGLAAVAGFIWFVIRFAGELSRAMGIG